MASNVPITKADASRVWRGSKETKDAVHALIDAGWEVVQQGKHYRAWCPCKVERANASVSCTPQNDGNLARRLMGVKDKCPRRHQLIH